MTAYSTEADPGPAGWIPVDQRRWGMDRRTFRPAIVVAILALLTVAIIPAVDAAVPGGRPVVSGDVLGLNGGVGFTPAVGWSITDGLLVGDPAATGYPAAAAVARDGVEVVVQTARFDGTPAALLQQVGQTRELLGRDSATQITSSPRSISGTAGDVGLVEQYRTAVGQGAIAAYVIGSTGVVVTIRGPQGLPDATTEQARQMLSAIAALPAEATR